MARFRFYKRYEWNVYLITLINVLHNVTKDRYRKWKRKSREMRFCGRQIFSEVECILFYFYLPGELSFRIESNESTGSRKISLEAFERSIRCD